MPVPIYITWVEWSNYGKVSYSRTQHVGHRGVWTHNLWITSQFLYPLRHKLVKAHSNSQRLKYFKSKIVNWERIFIAYIGCYFLPPPPRIAIFVEMMTGLMMSANRDMTSHFLWNWFVGAHAAIGLYYLNSYLGFTCGLFLGLYMMSIWPEMADRATSGAPAKTLTIAMATYLGETLLSVWTTAYNFVPGGSFTRYAYFVVFAGNMCCYN